MTIQITRTQLFEKRDELARNGITISVDSGEVTSHGAVISYAYDGTTLTLDVLKKPWYISQSLAEEKLREFFA